MFKEKKVLKNALVVRSNNLIESFIDMTKNEYKLTLYLISKINKDDKELVKQRVTVEDFANLLDITPNGLSADLKKFEKSLMNNNIQICFDNGDRITIAWYSYVKYIAGKATLEIMFNPLLEDLLLNIKNNYTKIFLNNILNLRGIYSIRLYELLKQYEKIGYRIFDLEDLREILNVPHKYLYADLKKRVVLPAQKELKKVTDLYFDFEEIKESRKVVAIKFYIRSQEAQITRFTHIHSQVDMKEPDNILDKINKTLGINFNLKALKKLMDLKGIEKINYYLDNWNRFDCSNKSNIAGFFYKAILEEWEIPQQGYARPVQATNYKQREYDDEYFDSLYDN